MKIKKHSKENFQYKESYMGDSQWVHKAQSKENYCLRESGRDRKEAPIKLQWPDRKVLSYKASSVQATFGANAKITLWIYFSIIIFFSVQLSPKPLPRLDTGKIKLCIIKGWWSICPIYILLTENNVVLTWLGNLGITTHTTKEINHSADCFMIYTSGFI